MKTATLKIEEKVTYMRHVRVQLPDGMDDDGLRMALNDADDMASESVRGYILGLSEFGILCDESIDDDMDSPEDICVEWRDFDVEPHTEQAPTGEDQ